MEIRGDRVTLRLWRQGDQAALVRHANNRRVWKGLQDRFPHPYGPGEADAWVKSQLEITGAARNLAIEPRLPDAASADSPFPEGGPPGAAAAGAGPAPKDSSPPRPEAVGSVGLQPFGDVFRRTAEVGYWIAEPWWGRGLATEALRCFTAYAFEHFPFERLQATVFATNDASCRVLEKAGFVLEGRLRRAVFKDGEILDALLWARLRDDD